jgi:hypothetical protein
MSDFTVLAVSAGFGVLSWLVLVVADRLSMESQK